MTLKGFAKESEMPRLREMVEEINTFVYLLPLSSDRLTAVRYKKLEPGRRYTKAEVARIEIMYAQVREGKSNG